MCGEDIWYQINIVLPTAESRLRHRVVREEGHRRPPQASAHEDHGALLRGTHMRQHCLRGLDGTEEIDIEDCLHESLAGLLERGKPGDACVVDQHVDASKDLDGLCYGALDGRQGGRDVEV